MFKLNYLVRLSNDVQIVGRTEYGEYLIKFKTKEGSVGIIWLPDELVSNCSIDSMGDEAIDLVRKHIEGVLVSNKAAFNL